jgi:hypothetical protein
MGLVSAADEQRLLMSEPALNAFVCAEMKSFCESAMVAAQMTQRGGPLADDIKEKQLALSALEDIGGATQVIAKLQKELEDLRFEAAAAALVQSTTNDDDDGEEAVRLICEATALAFTKLFKSGGNHADGQNDVLSNLGSAISFLRDEFTDDELKAPLSRVGLSSYEVAHHITDMYHHCAFRGTYTKTLQPSGSGEPARRAAVGLAPLVSAEEAAAAEEEEWVEVDECLVWSPTGKGCIHWASELDGNAQRRFEKVQMEGTRDPRRGGSGTTR